MNITEFSALAAEKMEAYLCGELHEEIRVKPMEIMKINDQSLHGISIEKGDDPAPTYYLDEFFGLLEHGLDLEELIRQLARTYLEGRGNYPVPAEELFDTTFSAVKHRAGLRLVGMEYNRKYLKTVPYKDVGNGYALLCDVKMKASDGGVFSTVVTNEMAEKNHYDMDQLFKLALDNAWRSKAATLRGVSEVMSYVRDEETGDEPETCYVLTTEQQRFGAAALFYPGTQAMIAHVLGEDYIAIPSSLHEFIILRASQVRDPQHLSQLVWEANHTLVGPADVLSDNALKYSKSTKELSLLTPVRDALHGPLGGEICGETCCCSS